MSTRGIGPSFLATFCHFVGNQFDDFRLQVSTVQGRRHENIHSSSRRMVGRRVIKNWQFTEVGEAVAQQPWLKFTDDSRLLSSIEKWQRAIIRNDRDFNRFDWPSVKIFIAVDDF